MAGRVKEFNEFREQMNKRILETDHRAIKRFYSVDTLTYEPGVLDAKAKEMLDIFSVALTVGGSIVIPHLRRAVAFLDELNGNEGE